MSLHIPPDVWQALCRTSAQYPTCTLRLRQHNGWIRGFTVEYDPGMERDVPCGTDSNAPPYSQEISRDLTCLSHCVPSISEDASA